MVISKQFYHDEVTGFQFGYSPIGKPTLYTHIYFVDGLLIDTGQRAAQKEIISKTKHLPIEQIYITHHHEDHSGNIPAFSKEFNCPIFAHSKCCELMKNPPKISFAQWLVWKDREPVKDLIPKDETIKTKKHEFQIVPIPGHASDMVALYEPNRKWLFSADLYINAYIGYFVYNEDIIDQIESIKRVLKLDFDILFCSHNPQFENGKEKLKQKLDFLESFYENVVHKYEKGLTEKEIFKDLNLKENRLIQFLSRGQLSKMNMVRSVIKSLNN